MWEKNPDLRLAQRVVNGMALMEPAPCFCLNNLHTKVQAQRIRTGTGDAGLAQLASYTEVDGYVNNL